MNAARKRRRTSRPDLPNNHRLPRASPKDGDRCFATTRFRCTKIRYTGNVCGSPGSVEIEPSVLLPVGGKNTLAFLSCSTCLSSWEINYVPIDQPWSVVNHKGDDRFKCPGCRKAVAWRIHGPTWRPTYGANSPASAPSSMKHNRVADRWC